MCHTKVPVTIIQIVSSFHHYLIPWEVISWYYGGVPMQLTQGLLRGNPNVTQPIPILFRSPIYLNHHGHHRCHHCYHSQLVILLSPYPPSSSPSTKRFHDELHFKDTLCNVIIPVRGVIHRSVREEVGISFQPGRGRGQTSWLPYSTYLYLDFHLCSMTNLKRT